MDSFIVHVKSETVYTDLAGDIEQDSIHQTKKQKNNLGGRIMKEFVALRPKMYSYLTHNDCVDLTVDGCVDLGM